MGSICAQAKNKCHQDTLSSIFPSNPFQVCSSYSQSPLYALETTDQRFVELVSGRKGQIIILDGSTIRAYVDDGFDMRFKRKNIFSSTVCIASCTILTHGNKCLSCTTRYRSDLQSLHSQWSRKRKTPSKNKNNKYLRIPQNRMLQARAQAADTEVKRLKSRIEESTLS